MNTKTTFGDRLRQAREEAGISQEALAKAVSMRQGAISLLERNINKSTVNVFALADALGVDARWLGTGTHRSGKHLNVDKQDSKQ